jgi:catechol 2,3-dioxygenase-like lactoylglutathione lyase family enzyme
MSEWLPTTGAWQEAVVSVRDLDRWIDALDALFGWKVELRGAVDPAWLAAWGLPAGAGAEEALLFHPDDAPRRLRLLRFDGVAQVEIRSSGHHWDTGGIFSLLAYVDDPDASFAAAQALGWSAHHDPVDMHFGDRQLRNVVLRAWDGVGFGLYRQMSPARAAPSWRKAGMAFNGQQSVRDIAPAREFYSRVLGWTPWFDGRIGLTCNNMGLPLPLVPTQQQDVIICAAGKDAAGLWTYGQVELVGWPGLAGRDFAARAVPPNLGVLALRIPVADLDACARRLEALHVPCAVRPCVVRLDPWGELRMLAVRTPDGVIFEFLERR